MPSSGGGSSDTKQVAEPWEKQKPYLEQGYKEAANLYENNPVIPWAGPTVAPVNDLNMQAIDTAVGNAGKINTASAGMLGDASSILGWGMGKAGAGAGAPMDLSAALAPTGAGLSATSGSGWSPGSYTPSAFSSSVGAYTPTPFEAGTEGTPDYQPRGYTANEYNPGAHTEFYLNPTENPSFMPGLQAALNPIYDKYLNEVLPSIDSQAQLQGAYGGSRNAVLQSLSTQLMNRELADTTSKAVLDAYFKERGMLADRENLEEQLASQRYLGLEDNATKRYTTEEGLLASADEAAASLASDRWKTGETLGSDRWKTEKTLESQRYLGLEDQATSRFNTGQTLSQRDAEAIAALKSSEYIAGLGANASIYGKQLDNAGAFDRTMLGLIPDLNKTGMLGLQIAPSMIGAAGDQLRSYDQQFLDEAIGSYNAAQAAPWANLQQFMGIVGSGSPGGTTNSSSTTSSAFDPKTLLGPALIAGAMAFSSRALKDSHGPAPVPVLPILGKLPVELWNYKGDKEVHFGTYAEDFKAASGLGDGATINLLDMTGLLLKGIQELTARVAELEKKLEERG